MKTFWKKQKNEKNEVQEGEKVMGKTKENGTTELVFILDKSGSMSGLEMDTIGGFNSMIEKQKQIPGRVYVSTVLFNHENVVVHDRVELSRVKPMTRNDYMVGGCTALLDAVGGAIHHIGNIHKYARPEDVPAHTMFVITTDGMENASRKYDLIRVKAMIERQKQKYGWEFLFMGANIDAIETARSFGIDANRAVNYHADGLGTRNVYEAVAMAAYNMRECRELDDDWKENVEHDYQSRQSRR